MDLVNSVPWGVAALIVVGLSIVAWRYPRTKKIANALKVPFVKRLQQPPAVKVEPPPPAVDENGPQPPGQSMPTGRPPETESGSGG